VSVINRGLGRMGAGNRTTRGASIGQKRLPKIPGRRLLFESLAFLPEGQWFGRPRASAARICRRETRRRRLFSGMGLAPRPPTAAQARPVPRRIKLDATGLKLRGDGEKTGRRGKFFRKLSNPIANSAPGSFFARRSVFFQLAYFFALSSFGSRI